MKSLQTLQQESASIQTEIGKLMLERSRSEDDSNKHINLTATVIALRQNLEVIQRELRERLTD